MRHLLRSILLLTSLLAACGTRGGLTLPPKPNSPAASGNPAVAAPANSNGAAAASDSSTDGRSRR
ncbi:MAG TPA: lipoprotein [Accumulibacter sp.]|nr:lipoprotein [Accumulibacter sp.]